MRRDKQETQAQFNRRVLLLGGAGALMFGGLGAQLYSLQILEQERYRTLSDSNQFSFRLQPPVRGRILDRAGEALAENRDNYRLFIVPEQAGDPARALARLARHLPITEARMERLLAQISRTPRFQPVTVAEDLDWETFARINLHLPELPGILPDVGEVRTYPHAQTMSHVTGYVQVAPPEMARGDRLLLHPGFRIGRTGAEIANENKLRGSAGQLKVEVNAFGRVIRELPEQSIPSRPGSDVHLSIDLRAQRVAMQALGQEAAAAVALDMVNGEILVLASTPGFDPNAFVLGIGQSEFNALNNNPYRPLFNKATTGLYAPASTIKGLISMAALEHGVINPSERIHCTGRVQLGNRTFHCWRREGHGHVHMHDAMKVSCDTYYYEVARRLGIERIRETALRCGLGQLFDIGMPIPERASGLVPSAAWKRARRGQPWTTGDTFNTGIGQGYMLSSPLQLAVMTARLATGKAVTPTLQLRPPGFEFESLGFAAHNLETVHRAMSGVVNEPGGTAYWTLRPGLGVEGARMCGKTGTAQVYSISPEERARGVRNQEDLPWRLRNHGLFIGYAPEDNPRYAVAIVVEHGMGGTRTAARPARDILRDLVSRDPASRETGPLAALTALSREGG
ncbi:penicillin-binding protein 2 [Alkalicaulis satelles]|uniref:Penicillin-binding protein 2 n=1 Tax=Alkalicaulis satelles TaxID=2609175 RepID=A0A5M6ZQS4_9PROT|nr:penicillin-binding protein 2 [Alkalicaulis satelles]KAA5804631.1 penicillin-binding protein 2 [Alkalicaulis satelles]